MRRISMKSISMGSINRIRNFDPNDQSWRRKYNKSLFERMVFLEDEKGNLSIESLLREYKQSVAEIFAYFLSLDPEEQAQAAPKLKPMVEEYIRQEDKAAANARRLLARDWPEVGAA
jgi:hypothetical protein